MSESQNTEAAEEPVGLPQDKEPITQDGEDIFATPADVPKIECDPKLAVDPVGEIDGNLDSEVAVEAKLHQESIEDPVADVDKEQPETATNTPNPLHAAVGAAFMGEEVTLDGQVRLSLAREDRNVSLRIYGPIDEALRALGPLRVQPGAYEDGRIEMRLTTGGRGRAVEARDRADYCKVEYRADPAVIALLRERHSHGRPLVADAVITIRIPPATGHASRLEKDEAWITDGHGMFCVVRFPRGGDGMLLNKVGGLDGAWRHVRPEDETALAKAKASQDFLERNI